VRIGKIGDPQPEAGVKPLQHTETHCNTLQHTATHAFWSIVGVRPATAPRNGGRGNAAGTMSVCEELALLAFYSFTHCTKLPLALCTKLPEAFRHTLHQGVRPTLHCVSHSQHQVATPCTKLPLPAPSCRFTHCTQLLRHSFPCSSSAPWNNCYHFSQFRDKVHGPCWDHKRTSVLDHTGATHRSAFVVPNSYLV